MKVSLFASVAAIALITAACANSSPSSDTAEPPAAEQPSPASSASAAAMMPLPPWTENMKTTITSPADGTKITSNVLSLAVKTSGYRDTCDLAGKPLQPRTGHWHVLLDKELVNMFCTHTTRISMQNVEPGLHTLTVVPAIDDHAEVEENASSIQFDYEPANALKPIKGASSLGNPTIKILSPRPGETVSGDFDVTVAIKGFHTSCDLMGKANVTGWGHWHVNLDQSTGPMMGMGTMIGMSCTNVFHASTVGLNPGETHTVIALLNYNDHAPVGADFEDRVDVKIGS